MTALVLNDVSKQFGGIHAVTNVTMTVPGGTITGLIGPNGAGKTTIVNLITGMLKLSTGRIELDGRDISEEPPHRVARLGISRTFQNIRLLPEASALDNIVVGFHRHETTGFVAQALGLPASRRETRALRERGLALMGRFGMAEFADYPAGALAYGHQRRVEMMRALATEPRVLLLDEPVAGMNDVEAMELGTIFRGLAAQGMALLLIEHNVRFVSELCSEIYVLDTGRLLAHGPAASVLADAAVKSAYLGTV